MAGGPIKSMERSLIPNMENSTTQNKSPLVSVGRLSRMPLGHCPIAGVFTETFSQMELPNSHVGMENWSRRCHR